MPKKIYFDEHIEYLREISPGRYNDEITGLFNKKFDMNATKGAIATLRQKHRILLTVPRARKQYTQEQLDYLRKLSEKGLFNAEITRKFNKLFGTSRTENGIQQQRIKYGIYTSARNYWKKGHIPFNKGKKGISYPGMEATQFKKGHKPQTWVPVGTETIDKDGYTKIKVANPNKWKYKHRLIWEATNGPVPLGHAVLFGDGDKRNFDIDNLILVSRAQLARMNQHGLIHDNTELTKTGIIIADIYNKIGERKRGEIKKHGRKKRK